MKKPRYIGALAIALALLMITAAPAAAANSTVNFSSDSAPNPWIPDHVTIQSHDMADSSTLAYEADDGSKATINGVINDSYDNPVSYTPTDVEFDDAGAFPHDKEDVSAVDNATEWSTSGANATKLSVSSVETASGVNAVQIGTDGTFASGDTATASFSNFSVTSDVQKRYLQMMLDVSTLDSGAVVEVRLTDGDGDYYANEINTSRSSGEDYITNATGEGIVFQRQVGAMTLTSAGDGSFGNIESVDVVVTDADATVEVSALNVEKMSQWKIGTKAVDTDSDDDLEEVDVYEKKTGGAQKVMSRASIGSTFDSAVIHGLSVHIKKRAEDLANGDTKLEANETGQKYPGYHGTVTIYYRLGLEDAYDLQHAQAELLDEQPVTNDRVISVELAEGVSESTDFEDIESWTDVSSSYDSEGKKISLDNTVQPGSDLVIKYKFKLTEDEWKNIQPSSTSGGAGGFWGGDGGFLGGFLSWLAAGVTAIVGSLAAIAKIGGGNSKTGGV